jgi:hypothetical protein
LTVGPDQQKVLAPGNFGAVSIQSRAKVTLSAGTYYFDGLGVEPQAEIALNTSGGPVVIYVRDTLMFRGKLSGSISSSTLLIGYFGSQTALLEAPMTAMVVAPNAQIVLGTGSPQRFVGRYFARNIELRASVTLALD